MPMRPFLDGRVAIVTGAGRGIGAATADALAGAGAAVALAARTREQLDAVAEDLSAAHGTEVLTCPTDVRDPRQVASLVQRTTRELGPVDILVNVAGDVEPVGRPTWEIGTSEWASAVATNLTGPFQLIAAVLPAMLENGYGKVVSVSSRAGSFAIAGLAPYSAAKAALEQLHQVVALETADSGVTVNTVLPGPTDTPTLDRVVDGLGAPGARRLVDRRRRSPDEAASLILWMCSPDTDRMTGMQVAYDDPWVRRRVARFRTWSASAA